MVGLLLNEFYIMKNQLYKGLIISLISGAVFFFIGNSLSASIFSSYILTIILSDYLNKEYYSGWSKLVPTFPIFRKTLVRFHFISHYILILIGLIISNVYLILLTHSFLMNFANTLIGICFVLNTSLIYPLMYKFGSGKILNFQIYSTIFSGAVFFVISRIIKSSIDFTVTNDPMILLIVAAIFLVISAIINFINYFISLKLINKVDF